jgi:hypothetical protein
MFRLAQEQVKPVEADVLKAIVQSIIIDQVKAHKPGTVARRDVHAFSHGTVAGVFTVSSGLPAEYAVGIFAKPRSYETQIRFSNGTPNSMADIFPNVRGIALKLKGVAGKKLLNGQEDSPDLDFLLANNETFFIANVEDYNPIHDLVSKNSFVQLFRKYPADTKRLLASLFKLVKNPLTTAYYSQSPYLFGEGKAVKYALIPTEPSSALSLPNVFDKEYLLHAVEKTLRNRSTRFTFCVQLQTENDPIEDPTVQWSGPFVALATLDVKRRGNVALLESSGEALSFNPWRVTAEHRPLGWANRLRQLVYKSDFEWRDGVNASQNQVKASGCPFHRS